MRVLVTGGTGFVGSHSVAALVRAGHEVRLLVRSPAKVEATLARHGVTVGEVLEGDVLDTASVEAAADGCKAALHAANVYSFDPRPAARAAMREVNEQGTERVLRAATDAGLDPIVYVSSYVALLPSKETLTPDSPVGNPEPAYCGSKAAGERIARRFQSEGAPVVITEPVSVWGPDDPNFGESATIAVSALRGWYRTAVNGVLPVVDVRDLATAHAALMKPGYGGRRFVMAGHNPQFRGLVRQLGDITGRNLGSVPVPPFAAMALGSTLDVLRRLTGTQFPFGREGVWVLAHAPSCDGSVAAAELGITWTPLERTLGDVVDWLHREGKITDRQAGRRTR